MRSASWRMALVVGMLWSAGCTVDREVSIVVSDESLGFRCTALDGSRLTTRIDPDRGGCFVLDYVLLTGLPRCRPESIRRSCVGTCPLALRLKFPMAPPPVGTLDAQAYIIDQLVEIGGHSEEVAAIQAEPLLSRLTFVGAPCEEVSDDGFLPEDRVVGCVSSCPTVLEQTPEMEMDLDVVGGACDVSHVVACSRLGQVP